MGPGDSDGDGTGWDRTEREEKKRLLIDRDLGDGMGEATGDPNGKQGTGKVIGDVDRGRSLRTGIQVRKRQSSGGGQASGGKGTSSD